MREIEKCEVGGSDWVSARQAASSLNLIEYPCPLPAPLPTHVLVHTRKVNHLHRLPKICLNLPFIVRITPSTVDTLADIASLESHSLLHHHSSEQPSFSTMPPG